MLSRAAVDVPSVVEMSRPENWRQLAVHRWTIDADELPAIRAFDCSPAALQVVSLRPASRLPAVRGFRFAPPPLSSLPAPAAKRASDALAGIAGQGSRLASRLRGRNTRLRVPQDVVKLQDRLYYLLQPSLETLLDTAQLRLAHDPFPYQLEGVAFLYTRHAGILADEMGLGKTMQAITAIRLLLHSGEIRSVLLICPKPLVTNWLREFQLWAPEIPIGAIGGDFARRRWQWTRPELPVKLANYELLLRDEDVLLHESPNFDLVVLDEAQRIKNARSSTSRIVRGLSRQRSWALTGTPIENSSSDLVGIFEFLMPGYLSADMTPRQMAEAAQDYILRRVKDDVLTELPPKLFRDATLDLTPQQQASYQRAEDDGVIALTAMGDCVTIQHVFDLILRLKQICNFDPATGASSKLDRLRADLEEVVASGQKAIVFSQWVASIQHLRNELAQWQPLEYHGRIPNRQRDQILQQFRDDPAASILLMSYGAGSVGLNLQFARYVFLFDRWWNPAVEDQAINRAHRIGASGPVTITRFITRGTIEERIDQILAEKRELFASVLDIASTPPQLGLSQDEIFGLFQLRRGRRSTDGC